MAVIVGCREPRGAPRHCHGQAYLSLPPTPCRLAAASMASAFFATARAGNAVKGR